MTKNTSDKKLPLDFLIGERSDLEFVDGNGQIEWFDDKIRYVVHRCTGKSVLDLGCVQHDPRSSSNPRWLHRAIASVAKKTVGLDLYEPGVQRLNSEGYNVVHGDAQNFKFEKKFNVIVAGDLIEHLSNFDGFFNSCRANLETDGVLVICTPNPWQWVHSIQSMKNSVPVNAEHTCWFCSTTLQQLAKRFGFVATEIEYGTRRRLIRKFPLPKRLRHGSLYATLRIANS